MDVFIGNDSYGVKLWCRVCIQDRLLQDAAAEHTWMYLLRVLEANMTSERRYKSIKTTYCSTKFRSWRQTMVLPIMTRRKPIHGGSAAASLLQTVLMGITIDRLLPNSFALKSFWMATS